MVLGLPGSSAERFARRLADALRTTCSVGSATGEAEGVRLVWPPEPGPGPASPVMFIDDGSVGGSDARTAALAAIATARVDGHVGLAFLSLKQAFAWARELAEGGLPARPGAVERLYLASGASDASAGLAKRLAEMLELPLIEPEAEHPGHEYEGWGPRYEALAREPRWLIHSPTWHAAEALCAAADLVILLERKAVDPREEFPAPQPQARKWQRIFAPWLNRYPVVEARLLEREIERQSGVAPILRLRTEAEREAVVAAIAQAAGAGAR